jgi:hypothetical protein
MPDGLDPQTLLIKSVVVVVMLGIAFRSTSSHTPSPRSGSVTGPPGSWAG